MKLLVSGMHCIYLHILSSQDSSHQPYKLLKDSSRGHPEQKEKHIICHWHRGEFLGVDPRDANGGQMSFMFRYFTTIQSWTLTPVPLVPSILVMV